VLRDPKDDYLIALAKSSGAEAIVTGSSTQVSSRRRSARGPRANCSA
jgi:predicted nucleic acid-binding protein